MNRVLICLAALILSSTGRAVTGEVMDGAPQTVVQVLQQGGYLATLEGANSKAPSIQVTVEGEVTQFYLGGCTASVCTRLRASTTFEVDADPDDVNDLVSTWNQDHDTQAFVDEDGSVSLDSAYVLIGGYTRANLLAWVKAYLDDLATFDDDLVSDGIYYVLDGWVGAAP